MFELFVFFAFASSWRRLMVITVRNPVHAALFLVLAFFTSAAIWLLLEAEFLAIVLVLVYVGAVMVLFLFVVMMLDINIARLRAGFIHLRMGGCRCRVSHRRPAVSRLHCHVVGPGGRAAAGDPWADYSNTEDLGLILYTDYVYPFEMRPRCCW